MLCGYSAGGPYEDCQNRGATLIFLGIMGNFGQFLSNSLKKYFIKPLTRNQSYMVCKVPTGPCFYFFFKLS